MLLVPGDGDGDVGEGDGDRGVGEGVARGGGLVEGGRLGTERF